MATKHEKEKQVVTKDDVGEFPKTGENRLSLLKPPTSLMCVAPLSEAEKAFLDTAEKQSEGPSKLPVISINHRAGEFVMPSGETIDGHDGLCGFIVAHFTTRAYYAKPYDAKGEKVPPDCTSIDCITPDANVQHKQSPDCASCKWNAFGTAPVGKGKACREFIRVFLVNPEFGDPPLAMLTLPPSAIGKFYGGQMMLGGKRGYLDQLKARHRAWQIVWSKITLSRDSDDAVNCIPDFEMGDVASLDVAKSLASINNQFVSAIKAARMQTVMPEEVK